MGLPMGCSMYVAAIVLAAGRGVRFKSKISKPLITIHSQPLIIYCLKVLSAHRAINEIVIVVNSQNRGAIRDTIRRWRIDKIKNIVLYWELEYLNNQELDWEAS